MNSCCFFFSLRTGTILLLIYDWAYLFLQFWIASPWSNTSTSQQEVVSLRGGRFRYRYRPPNRSPTNDTKTGDSGWRQILELLQRIVTVTFLVSTVGIINAVIFERSRSLLAYLTVKPLMITLSVIFWTLTFIFHMSITWLDYSPTITLILAILFIAITCIVQAFSVYFWVVVYNFYKELKRKHIDQPVAASEPHAAVTKSPQGENSPARKETSPVTAKYDIKPVALK